MKKHAFAVAALAAVMVLPGLFLACGSLMAPDEVLRYYGAGQGDPGRLPLSV